MIGLCVDAQSIELIQSMQKCEERNFTQYGNYSTRERKGFIDHKNFGIKIDDNEKRHTVSNIASFISFIKEELKRRKNPDGTCSTVTFNSDGGIFVADDDFYRGVCCFSRTTSQQWNVLKSIVNTTLNHEKFLEALCSLKQSIPMFNELYKDYARLRIIGKSELNSEPTFFNGESTNGYRIRHTISKGTADEEEDIVPADFSLELPYAKGSKRKYCINIETLFVNTMNNQIAVKIICPEFEQIEEQAILDEVNLFKEELKGVKELLILEDY